MKQTDWKDLAIRGGIVLSGILAAAIFVLESQAGVLAPLALGGAAGAFAVRWFQQSGFSG
ncbi:MAG TPA: hypothetical protein VM534_00780 [Thermoanaerobaculia bacterium]|nr:hypothetical protein [Thermoanaerobaculia bacterium]